MQWENMNSNTFKQAVDETGLCLLPLGVVERHSDHLPLGTDFLNVHKACVRAAELEPAVVFPPFYFGQIYEARCFPGTLTLKPTLLLELLFAVIDEIGRNGFKKILLVNGHGGNNHLLAFLAQCSLWEEKPYTLYVGTQKTDAEGAKRWAQICETELHGHACECETSISLHNHPQLVSMDQVPEQPGAPLNRMEGLPFTGISWYANHPEHYCGDARSATREKGAQLFELQTEYLARVTKAVKADTAGPALTNEFFRRADSLGK